MPEILYSHAIHGVLCSLCTVAQKSKIMYGIEFEALKNRLSSSLVQERKSPAAESPTSKKSCSNFSYSIKSPEAEGLNKTKAKLN